MNCIKTSTKVNVLFRGCGKSHLSNADRTKIMNFKSPPMFPFGDFNGRDKRRDFKRNFAKNRSNAAKNRNSLCQKWEFPGKQELAQNFLCSSAKTRKPNATNRNYVSKMGIQSCKQEPVENSQFWQSPFFSSCFWHGAPVRLVHEPRDGNNSPIQLEWCSESGPSTWHQENS